MGAWKIATQEVQQACEILLNPSSESLDRSAVVLGAAANRVRTAGPPDLAEARDLRAAVLKAGDLLESAAAYHRGWQRLLQARTAGYNSAGEAAPLSAGGRIHLQG